MSLVTKYGTERFCNSSINVEPLFKYSWLCLGDVITVTFTFSNLHPFTKEMSRFQSPNRTTRSIGSIKTFIGFSVFQLKSLSLAYF